MAFRLSAGATPAAALGAFALGAMLLAGCASKPAVRAENAWIRAADSLGTTAAYMTVVNDGSRPVTVTGITGDCADRFQLHETVTEGSELSMHAVHSLDVPAHGTLELRPGGDHVMVMGLTRNLEPGLQPGAQYAVLVTRLGGEGAQVGSKVFNTHGRQMLTSPRTGA